MSLLPETYTVDCEFEEISCRSSTTIEEDDFLPVLVFVQMNVFIPFIGHIVTMLKLIVIQEKIIKLHRIDNCYRFISSR
jgi:hypothetical protein